MSPALRQLPDGATVGDGYWALGYFIVAAVPLLFIISAVYSKFRDHIDREAAADIEMAAYQRHWFPWRIDENSTSSEGQTRRNVQTSRAGTSEGGNRQRETVAGPGTMSTGERTESWVRSEHMHAEPANFQGQDREQEERGFGSHDSPFAIEEDNDEGDFDDMETTFTTGIP